MKVLIATDGSPSAQHAEALSVAIEWPAGTELNVLSVDQLIEDEIAYPADRFMELDVKRAREIDDRITQLVGRLNGPDRIARGRSALGRPATVIVSEAIALGADLIIIGSHNHGAVASFAIGSVSAEVVDHAPCPVLVARRSSLGPIVLGHDGSAGSMRAEELVATWPFLAHEPVRVVSVTPLLSPWYLTLDGGLSPAIDGALVQELIDERQENSRRIASAAAGRLAGRGLDARAEPRDGPPADGLLDAVAASKAQLVVVGSRGKTGVARLLLGSVARTILYRAPCSVLIVREPRASTGAHEPQRQPVAAGSK